MRRRRPARPRIAQARDTLISVGRERGLDLRLNTKANGKLSLDAFQWVKQDGTVAIIDFALASKALDRSTKMQWLDVTNGGGAPQSSELADFVKAMLKDMFDRVLDEMGQEPGAKKGASKAERTKFLGGFRDKMIAAAKAQGIDAQPHVKENGEISLDSFVVKKPDGTDQVVQFAKDAMDLTKDLELQLPPELVPPSRAG